MKMRPLCVKDPRGRVLATSTVIALLLHGLALAGMPWLLPAASPMSTTEQGISIDLAPVSAPPLPALPEQPLPAPEPEPAPQKTTPARLQKRTAPQTIQRSARAPRAVPADKTTRQNVAVPQATSPHPSAVYDNPKPVYPELARKRGQEGTVRLRAHVDEKGRVITVEVAQSSGWRMLDVAAVKTVRRWRFQPGMRAGIAVQGTVMIPVRFSLQ